MLLDLISLDDWKKVDDIRLELKERYEIGADRRVIRKEREIINEKYYNHEMDYCIAKSNKGYKKTTDEKEIIVSENFDLKQALDLLNKVRKSRKARGENLNLKLEIDNNELIFVDEGGLR